MEPIIPVEIFRKKSNTFRGIIFFPFLPKRPKFSVSFVWITSAKLHVERKWKMYRYFVNGTTQSCSCFRFKKNTSYIWREILTEISVQMVSAHNHAFSRSIYRKKTFTGLYTKWDSFTPPKIQHKLYPHTHFSLLFAHHSLFWVVLWMNWGTCYYQDGYFWPSGVLNYHIRY